MAPLSPANTARFWLDYDDGVNEHSMMARIGPTATLVNIKTSFHNFLTALAPALDVITVIGCRVAVSGSNVTNPTPWTGAASYGSGAMPVANAPRELRFIGRAVDGRRVSTSVYGYAGATPDDYRVDAVDSGDVAAAISELGVGGGLSVWLSISGLVPVWKAYASFNFNSYWEREARP